MPNDPTGYRITFACIALLSVACLPIAAAQPGLDEFQEANQEINSWFFRMSDLILVIGAIAGITGGARVYANWQAGRDRIDTQVSGWLLACIFLSLVAAAIRALYSIN
jgi:hypothetical protein